MVSELLERLGLKERPPNLMAEHAARGAALLDELVPYWARRVNPRTIDVLSLLDCPLAQVYGSFAQGLWEAHARVGLSGRYWDMYAYGFNASVRDNKKLNQAWRAEVERRREAAA